MTQGIFGELTKSGNPINSENNINLLIIFFINKKKRKGN